MLSVGQQQCCGQHTQAYIVHTTQQVNFLSKGSSDTHASCCFFHWSCFLLLFKAALESADMSHCSWTAARVTKSSREGSPPTVATLLGSQGRILPGCGQVVWSMQMCGLAGGLEGRHPGKMMHCWTYRRKFWLGWRFFKYECLENFISETSVAQLCFIAFPCNVKLPCIYLVWPN